MLLAAALAGCVGPRLDYEPRVVERKAPRPERVVVLPFLDGTGRSRDDQENSKLPPPPELARHFAAYLRANGYPNAVSAASEEDSPGDVVIRGKLVRLDERQAAAYVEAFGAGGWPLWRGDVSARDAALPAVLDGFFEKVRSVLGGALDKRR